MPRSISKMFSFLAPCSGVYGYSITYKSGHQIDDIYFTRNNVRTIPIMKAATDGGCTITQPGSCNGGNISPWDSTGKADNSGCWSFGTHSIVCDHDISSDEIHIHFWANSHTSTSGFTVKSLARDSSVIEVVLDVGSRSGLDAEHALKCAAAGMYFWRNY